jgi:glycosyltransferase involved in cell wall biosynthesis
MEDKKFVVVSCPIASRSGYGSHSRDLVRSLIKEKPDWDIKIISQRWGATPLNVLMNGVDDDLIARLWMQPQLPQQPDIWIQITVPNEFQPVGKFNIGITAGIETTIADPSFIEGLNRMDLNIVPSEFTKEVLEKTKFQKMDEKTQQQIGELVLEKPVEVVFEGVDCNLYKKTQDLSESVVTELSQIKENFCYLFTGHWLQGDPGQDRKDVGLLVRTFFDNFKDTKNPPALVLKTSSASFSVSDRFDIIQKIEAMRRSINSDNLPNVYLLHGDLTDTEMNSLYNHPKIKAMVSFTKGEGYGRPLAEFARTGKPILVSNWSGHLDFINPKYHILLPGQLTPVHKSAQQKGMINEGSKWFTVDYPMAGGIMREVHKNYKKYAEKSRGSGHYMKTEFSLDAMDKKFIEVIEKGLEGKPQQATLNLPKLKKLDNEPQDKPEIKLPKLKKLTD